MDGSTLVSPSAEVMTPQRPARQFSPWLEAWRRFRRHKMAFASTFILLAMILAIALGPFVWKVAINDIDFAARMETPSWAHPLGTDDLGPVLVAATIDVAAAIIAESTLSFLGLGFPPDIPTWGRILYDAKDYLDIAPHWALFPGAAIFLTVLTINFIGDGLRDALDPRKVM